MKPNLNSKKQGRPARPITWPTIAEFTINDILEASIASGQTFSKVAIQTRVNKAVKDDFLINLGPKGSGNVGKKPVIYKLKPIPPTI